MVVSTATAAARTKAIFMVMVVILFNVAKYAMNAFLFTLEMLGKRPRQVSETVTVISHTGVAGLGSAKTSK